jgi:hypothetical protein
MLQLNVHRMPFVEIRLPRLKAVNVGEWGDPTSAHSLGRPMP